MRVPHNAAQGMALRVWPAGASVMSKRTRGRFLSTFGQLVTALVWVVQFYKDSGLLLLVSLFAL